MTSAAFRQPVSVLVVVYTIDADVLLLRRVQPFDFWQSVTGTLDAGESAANAARRELREETGLTSEGKLTDSGIERTFTIDPRWQHRFAPGVTENLEYEWHYRLRDRPEISIDKREHSAWKWCSIDCRNFRGLVVDQPASTRKSAAATLSPHNVILVHGVWMPGAVMLYVKIRLESQHGLTSRLFSYPSILGSLDENAELLAELVREQSVPVHLVGHSLGGIVALRMLTIDPQAQVGRIVCMGSPLSGSSAADDLSQYDWAQNVLGKSVAEGVVEQSASEWAARCCCTA